MEFRWKNAKSRESMAVLHSCTFRGINKAKLRERRVNALYTALLLAAAANFRSIYFFSVYIRSLKILGYVRAYILCDA